jgi:hypothetical protein
MHLPARLRDAYSFRRCSLRKEGRRRRLHIAAESAIVAGAGLLLGCAVTAEEAKRRP